jgi:F-type H+-transporting ATPase subunit delta
VSNGAAAERYARAIFELGSEAGQLDQVSQEFEQLALSWAQVPNLRLSLENPMLDEAERAEVLKELARHAQISRLSMNALLVLSKRRRLGAIPEIARHLRSLSDEQNGVCRAKIVSAAHLPEAYFKQLTQALEQSLGKRIIVELEEDSSLIGGVVVHIGDNTWDGSIKGRLEELERKLLASA